VANKQMVVVSTAFDFAGHHYDVGDVVDTDSYVYSAFPGNFSLQAAYVTGSPGTVLTGGTLGTVITGKVPITNDGGTVLGYVPIYNEVTGS